MQLWKLGLSLIVSAFAPTAALAQDDAVPAHPLPENRWDYVGGLGGSAAVASTKSPWGKVNLLAGYDNHWSHEGDFGIEIDWTLLSAETDRRGGYTMHRPAYLVTDVVERAAFTDTLYVAGWDEASGAVLVEEWRLSSLRFLSDAELQREAELGERPLDPTESSVRPIFETRRLFTCPHLPPIASITAHPFAEQLWIISATASDERTLWVLPLDDSEIACEAVHAAFRADLPLGPALTPFPIPGEELGMLNTYKHPERGLLLHLDPSGGYGCIIGDGNEYVFWDHDLDGILDELEVISEHDFILGMYQGCEQGWKAPAAVIADAAATEPPSER